MGCTSKSNKVLERIVDNGYLDTVKLWLDDALNGRVGGIDLLLHLLSHIVDLPVTKATVKQSGMGKAIGTIEKHSMCKGTPNEGVISDRVSSIKEAWQMSVKARKTRGAPTLQSTNGTKREATAEASPTPAKRAKVGVSPSFSSLMKKVSSSSTDLNSEKTASGNQTKTSSPSKLSGEQAKKKNSNRVKWSDHFGGQLESSRVIEGDSTAATSNDASAPSTVSWTDRKKRDRAREKELLASVKKSKLLDDEDESITPPPPPPPPSFKATIQPTMTWVVPMLLPERTDVSKPVLNSAEYATQVDRTKTINAAEYFSDSDIPPNPALLSDVEQAFDMTSQSSAVVEKMPFFAPQEQAPAQDSISVTVSAPATNFYGTDSSTLAIAQQPSSPATAGATPELLQALGLPLFLVGQDVQALQTLASSPGLLSTMLDSNGMYDQNRLISLVQTLSGASVHTDASSMYSFSHPPSYGSATVPSYSTSPTYVGPSGGGSKSNSDDGNLHVAGYGPGTTQTDIITLFLPYVKVDEVVMKGTFAFVNTSDPLGAHRAKEALQGTLLNSMPVRINAAQRKSKDTSTPVSSYGPTVVAPAVGQLSGTTNNPFGPAHATPATQQLPPSLPPPPPQQPQQPTAFQQNVDHVKDDRGNPATKNLFVAGYGPGTTEAQLREIFNQHSQVVGVVLKGNFTFVNTSSKQEAVRAREMLGGQTINGGPLRINFAKETGRLGTSFDLTYNERSGPNARKAVGSTGAPSYYGRGF